MIRTLLIDDHSVLLGGLKALLDASQSIQVVGTATTIFEAVSLARALTPELIVLDLRIPDSQGTKEIQRFKDLLPGVKLAVLTGYGIQARPEAINAGADLYLTKDAAPEEIRDKLIGLFPGRRAHRPVLANLSPREVEIARLVAQGLTNPEVANVLGLSSHTVKTHVSAVMSKLGVRDRVSLALYFSRQSKQS